MTCPFVHKHVLICTCKYAMQTCKYAHVLVTYTNMFVFIYTFVYKNIPILRWIWYICSYTSTYVPICIYINVIQMCSFVYINIPIYTGYDWFCIHIRVCTYMFIFMYKSAHLYVLICLHAYCINELICICTHLYRQAATEFGWVGRCWYIFIYIYIYMYIYTYAYVYRHICVSVCIYMYKYMNMYIYIYTYIYIYMYTCICMYIGI